MYGEWQAGVPDHTENNSTASIKGYMMLIGANVNPDQVLNITANNLCIGSTYEFSIYIANAVKSPSGLIQPNINFEVRTATSSHTLLATLSTGNITEYPTLTWQQYGISFTTPTSSVALLAISNAPGGSGNDFVIDDVELRICSTTSPAMCTAR
ncbi:unnamed protein product [Rotaria sp. Silwood2]|nr:unnamed protein product [Rotaria sp. Silwood2]CAF4027674.1 unnamed protein product [Rotaria sp. Silwood2]